MAGVKLVCSKENVFYMANFASCMLLLEIFITKDM